MEIIVPEVSIIPFRGGKGKKVERDEGEILGNLQWCLHDLGGGCTGAHFMATA